MHSNMLNGSRKPNKISLQSLDADHTYEYHSGGACNDNMAIRFVYPEPLAW